MQTPWGESDYSQNEAPGVTYYGTPRHGGLRVDRCAVCYDLAEKMANESRYSFTQDDCVWLEEDCDAPRLMQAAGMTKLLASGKLQREACTRLEGVADRLEAWWEFEKIAAERTHGTPECIEHRNLQANYRSMAGTIRECVGHINGTA